MARLPLNGTANNAPTGAPIFATVQKNVASSNNVGYNLVGNPFPCAMDAAQFVSTNSSVIAGVIYLWDDDATGGSGWNTNQDYVTWNNTGSVAGTNSGTLFKGHIASGQSFFVDKLNNGTDSVQFQNSMRTTQNSAFFRQAPVQRLWLSVTTSQGYYNETLIGFLDDATDGADWGYDAKKIKGNQKVALYSKLNGADYAIQGLPLLTGDKTVVLGMDLAVSGTHTLSLKAIENLDETVEVFLEDTQLGIFQNLRLSPDYTFTSGTTANSQRFVIHFTAPLEITTVKRGCDYDDGQIMLNQPGSQHWNYMLTDAQGTLLTSGNNLNGQISITALKEGSYTLALSDADGYQLAKTIQVEAKKTVTSGFTADKAAVFENEPITFTDLSSGADHVDWDFGDGTISSDQKPVHEYPAAGLYNVQLTSSNDECQVQSSRQVEVISLLATGINEQGSDEPVSIFQSGTTIFIQFAAPTEQDFTVQVRNVAGQLVSLKTISGMVPKHQLHLPELAAGYYFLQVQSRDYQLAKPFIIINK